MSEKLDAAWKAAAENPGTPIDIGRVVVCDFCNDDHTDSTVQGGLIFGSYALCPKCEHKIEGEEDRVHARCPPGMTFGDFVRAYRGDNNTISITTTNTTRPKLAPVPCCRVCHQPFSAANVHTDAGWRETRISRTCENCWDAMFAEMEDGE